MKELIVAKHAGFCFGVQRAVNSVLRASEKPGELFTYGDLIHNESVVERLREHGVHVLAKVEDIPDRADVTVAIRSHGVPRDTYKAICAQSAHVMDLTCPFVKRIHDKVESANGRTVYIVGAPDHPEVIGIRGWATGPCYVVPDPETARAAAPSCGGLVVAQTTITRALWDQVVEELEAKCENLELFASICDTTQRRQEEACELAEKCDMIVVIGGKKSSNTAKLYQLCSERCERVTFISSGQDIPLEKIMSYDTIGIIAGASTPHWLIREVQARMSEVENVQGTTVVEEAATNTAPAEETTVTAESVEEEVPQAQEAPTEVVEEATAQIEETTPDQPEEPTDQQPEEPASAPEAEQPAAQSDSAPAAEETQENEDSTGSDEADFMAEVEKSLVSIRKGQIVTGTVVQVSDSEICVNIGYKSDGILRKENLSATGDINPADVFHEGDEIEAEIVNLNDGEGNVLLSRKSIESKLRWKELVDSLEEDQVHTVRVDKVVKGGVLAKLEGYDAFIPASHLSLKYVEDLTQFVGQDLDVDILEADKRQRRFVLSHKKVLERRRAEEEQRLYNSSKKGDVVKGKVKRLTDFGAFVDIGGVDGLLHVTDIAWTKVKHPSDVLNVGDEIDVQILNVDPEKKRISLGLKQLQPKPWDLVPEKYIVGDTVEGTVVRIMPFGAFVALEPTIDGLIHISQVTNRRLERVEEVLHIGDKVTAKIMEVNPSKRRISLSLRALMDDQRGERSERGNRGGRGDRRRNNDDYDGGNYGSYRLPPVETVSVSVADAFKGAEEAAARDGSDE